MLIAINDVMSLNNYKFGGYVDSYKWCHVTK
jgi:hypothetical protein